MAASCCIVLVVKGAGDLEILDLDTALAIAARVGRTRLIDNHDLAGEFPG